VVTTAYESIVRMYLITDIFLCRSCCFQEVFKLLEEWIALRKRIR